MRRVKLCLALGGVLVVGAACVSGMRPSELDVFGREFLTTLQRGDSAAALNRLDPGLTTWTAQAQLMAVAESLRLWAPDSTHLVGWNVVESAGRSQAALTYEVHGAHGWALVGLQVQKRREGQRVTGMQLVPRVSSLREENSFTLVGKSAGHYLVLAGAIASVLFTLCAAVQVATSSLQRRWLWVFVSLLGIGQLGINWSTGQLFFNPVYFRLFGAGVERGGEFAPWIVVVGLPVGAAYALWRAKQLPPQAPAPTTPGSARAAA